MIIKFSFLGSEYSFDESKYVVLPVIYGNLKSREAAIEIIKQSLNLPGYNNKYNINYRDIPVYTFDLIILEELPEKAISELNFIIKYILDKAKIPIMIGADHSITIATRGLFNNYLIIDAHMDMYEEFAGNKYNHACVTRRLLEKTNNVFHYGVRIIEPEEELKEIKSPPEKLEEIYLSIDMDVLDSSYVNTNIINPGGISYSELLEYIDKLKAKIVGLDIVEVVEERKSAYLAADLLANILAKLES